MHAALLTNDGPRRFSSESDNSRLHFSFAFLRKSSASLFVPPTIERCFSFLLRQRPERHLESFLFYLCRYKKIIIGTQISHPVIIASNNSIFFPAHIFSCIQDLPTKARVWRQPSLACTRKCRLFTTFFDSLCRKWCKTICCIFFYFFQSHCPHFQSHW